MKLGLTMRDGMLGTMSVDTTDSCSCLPRLRTEFKNENEYVKSMHIFSISILVQLRGGDMEWIIRYMNGKRTLKGFW